MPGAALATRKKQRCGCDACCGKSSPSTAGLSTYLRQATPGPAVGAHVHTGREVRPILREFGTVGLSVGRHVLVDPDLSRGASERVARHELTHAAQARWANPRFDQPFTLSSRGDLHEREAETTNGILAGLSRIGPNVISRYPYDGADPPGSPNRKLLADMDRRAKEAEAAAEKRHQQWGASHQATFGTALKDQTPDRTDGKTDLLRDLDSTQQMVIAQRVAVLSEATAATNLMFPLPPELGARWVAARQAVESVNATITTGDVPYEIADASRGSFNTFYRTLLQVTRGKEAWERRQEEFSAAFDQKPAPPPCPGGCHAPTPARRIPYKAPPPQSPDVLESIGRTDVAATAKEWTQVLKDFQYATGVMDSLVLPVLPESSKARQGFEFAQDLERRQSYLQRDFPNAVRIPAVFYQKDQFEKTKTAEGAEQASDKAKSVPWMFYLYYTGDRGPGQPLAENAQWVLEDLTSPKRYVARTESLSDAERAAIQAGKPIDPPKALFEQLNDKLQFPEGQLYWTMPSGQTWTLQTTEPWSLSDWLKAIGMTLTALALIAGTAGMGTAAAVLLIGSAAFSIAGTVEELNEKQRAGVLTQKDMDRAMLTIALDVASALTVGLGRIAAVAGDTAIRTGMEVSRIGLLANRLWLPARMAQTALEGVNIIVVTHDFVEQFRVIQNSTLTKEQKEVALAKLAGLGVLTLGLQTLSLKSGIKELQAGSPLTVAMDRAGRLKLSQGGVDADVGAGGVKVKTGADAPLSPPKPAGEPEVRPNDKLQSKQVIIEAEYGLDGRLVKTRVVHAPDAPPHDIKIHQDACALLEKASGLDGRLQQVLAKLRLAAAGGLGTPLHLQVEIWKHQRMIKFRQAQLTGGPLSDADLKVAQSDLAKVESQLASLEKTAADPKLRAQTDPTRIATEGEKPPGYPSAPSGMYYELALDGKWVLRPRPGYKGPRLEVELDATGAPTGRVSNSKGIRESGILDQPLTPEVKKQLEDLGYVVDSQNRITRPRGGYTDKTASQYMEPLTVVDGKVKVSQHESFLDVQARLKGQLTNAQEKAFEKLKGGAVPGQTVLLVEGIIDTGVRWKDILGPKQQARLREILVKEGGIAESKADELIDGLLKKKETLKFVAGTEPARQFPYRSQYADDLPKGAEVHHFDPLYVGGGHELLIALGPKAHDSVHGFFNTLRLPPNSKIGPVQMDSTSLRNAVKGQTQKAAVIVGEKGEVTYKPL